MKKLILFGLILSSCGAPWHIKRAVKKDPTIIQTQSDTVRFTINRVDTIETMLNDTIFREFRTTLIDTFVVTNYKFIDGYNVRTRQEVRQDARTERTEARQDNRTKRKNKKQEERTERTKIKRSLWIIIGVVLLFALYLIKRERDEKTN